MKKTKLIRFMFSLFFLALLLFPSRQSFAASVTKCYTIRTGNTEVYNNTSLRRTGYYAYGWIYDTDEITVLSVTSGYCRVRYPLSGSRTKEGYIPRSAILLSTGQSWINAPKAMTAYRRASSSTSYGVVFKNDRIRLIGTSGSYTQIKYPVSSGYKYAFVKTSDLNTGSSGSSGTADYVRISDGWYMIQAGCSTDRVLDINNWNLNNGGNLEIYQKNNTTNQRFYLSYYKDGYYRIRVGVSGKYLDVAGGSSRSGANVQQYDNNYSSAQLWKIRNAGNGYYYLQSRLGTYLDNANNSSALGNNVIAYSFNGSSAQKWRFISTSSVPSNPIHNGWYMIQSANSSQRGLDIHNWNMNNGGNLETYQKNNTTNQRFYLSYGSDGYYTIMCGHSRRYLDVAGGSRAAGTNMQQWEKNGSDAQKFQIIPLGNGYYYIRSKLGNLIDNSNNSTKLGNNVITWPYAGSNAQRVHIPRLAARCVHRKCKC